MYTVHRRTLPIESNVILIGLTEQGKTWVTENYELIVVLKKEIHF